MRKLKNISIKPWGKYLNLVEEKDKWHLKIIILKKDQRLSLQKHKLRTERWVVVEGKVKAEIGKEVFTLSPNETVVIKKSQIHRMKAITDSVVIEVTFGTHKEKDIERIEDDYGRSKNNFKHK
jgi:mannose-6-phosphate isomerase-like protein (cupin superfamily)